MKKLALVMAIALLLAVSHTAGAASLQPKLSDTLELEGNYKLHLESIDISSPERSAVLQLRHGGVLDEKVVMSGDAFRLYDGQALILNGTVSSIFSGANGNLISIRDLVQYDKETGEVNLVIDRVILFIPIHPTFHPKPLTATIDLKQGYEITLMDVDKAVPEKILLQFTRGGETIDERIVSLGDYFRFYDGNALIANARFDQIFQGTQGLMVQIRDLNQYNKATGKPLIYFDRVILET